MITISTPTPLTRSPSKLQMIDDLKWAGANITVPSLRQGVDSYTVTSSGNMKYRSCSIGGEDAADISPIPPGKKHLDEEKKRIFDEMDQVGFPFSFLDCSLDLDVSVVKKIGVVQHAYRELADAVERGLSPLEPLSPQLSLQGGNSITIAVVNYF